MWCCDQVVTLCLDLWQSCGFDSHTFQHILCIICSIGCWTVTSVLTYMGSLSMFYYCYNSVQGVLCPLCQGWHLDPGCCLPMFVCVCVGFTLLDIVQIFLLALYLHASCLGRINRKRSNSVWYIFVSPVADAVATCCFQFLLHFFNVVKNCTAWHCQSLCLLQSFNGRNLSLI